MSVDETGLEVVEVPPDGGCLQICNGSEAAYWRIEPGSRVLIRRDDPQPGMDTVFEIRSGELAWRGWQMWGRISCGWVHREPCI